MKIWAKTVLGEKLTRNIIYQCDVVSDEDAFVSALQEICGQMDIPTPISTKVNFNHFVMFNNTKFKARDFVESIDFDLLDIEAVHDKAKKQ